MKNKNNDKDIILKLTLSVLLVFFGVILLIDQLDVANNPFVTFIDDLFAPWYTIIILFIASCLLAYAIIKKAPIIYVLSMLFAGIFLVISLSNKVKTEYIGAIIFIVPMFIGIGFILADRICKWSPKILRFGVVLTMASAVVLVSVVLDAWKYVIPIVVILIGIAYMIFEIFALKQKNIEKPDDHYVTYTPKNVPSAENEQNKIADEQLQSDNATNDSIEEQSADKPTEE